MVGAQNSEATFPYISHSNFEFEGWVWVSFGQVSIGWACGHIDVSGIWSSDEFFNSFSGFGYIIGLGTFYFVQVVFKIFGWNSGRTFLAATTYNIDVSYRQSIEGRLSQYHLRNL